MRRLQLLFLMVFLLGIVPAFSQRIVGYYPYYRTFSTFDANIQWSCITDVNYAFAFLDGSGNVTIQTPSNFSGVQSRCKPISSTGPNLWMSIGGVGQASYFSSTAASGTATTNMV
ncbi:MAG: hypothetical protein JWO58_2752, partial [Chitinophagaceae bacterium]|nr:hypothetical protein [Chitinophagaceae bacterium]